MRPRSSVHRLLALAAEQWGYLTDQQAHRFDVSDHDVRRLAKGGVLERGPAATWRATSVAAEPFDHIVPFWLAFEPNRTARERLVGVTSPTVVAGSQGALCAYGVPVLDPTERPTFKVAKSYVGNPPAGARVIVGEGLAVRVNRFPVTPPSTLVVDLLLDHVDAADVGAVAAQMLADGRVERAALDVALAPLADRFLPNPGQLSMTTWLLALNESNMEA